jgi:glyoxylase-like metal-dependent hydrolase (beta-lactamase superfamily II)
MTELTRRSALAGAAAATLTPLAATTAAQAAAPMSGKQAPGFYRTKIGSYEVTVLLDGVRPVKLENSPIRNASLDDVKSVLTARRLPTDQLGFYFHPIVVNTGAKLVLIDTGNGPGSRQTGTGLVPDNLIAAGIDPKTIDAVIFSHFHGDHISGLRTADGALAYPNAEIMVPAKEWAFWSDEGAASRAPQGQQATFQNTKRIFGPIADKITKYEWGKEVAPGITALDTNGHTPGHTSFMIASGSGSLLYQADVTAGYALLQFHNPEWLVGGDMDGTQAVATRRKLYDQLATDKTLMSGYHIPFPSLGYIEKAGTAYRFVPASWNPVL